MWDSVHVSFKFLPEGTSKLWFDSVWMGVTGGAMFWASFGGGIKILVRDRQRRVSIRGEIGGNSIIPEYRRESISYEQR